MVKNQTSRGAAGASGPSGSAAAEGLEALDRLRGWFASRGWRPFAFQERVWSLFMEGRGGLVLVPTGSGKTYAATLGPVAVAADAIARGAPGGLRVLYISPLRALSRDIESAIRRPIEDLGLGLRVESRTGDTGAAARGRQRRSLPEVLVTTPESLTLLLSHASAAERFAGLVGVVVDEWHELLTSKRGTQVELALARLRRYAPGVRAWGLSATIANERDAARALVGVGEEPAVVRAAIDRPVSVRGLVPPDVRRFPWAGHSGLAMLEAVLGELDPDVPTLVFTNTRSQAERWHRAITLSRPAWADRVALHHGSIDRADRERVEAGVKSGRLGIVVCTSSLDLGVDFGPVDRVVQIGSPKGVARLMQRAGRARHRPGEACEVTCVPAHALELVEVAAVREAIAAGAVERRDPVRQPLDVLAQHLVTAALGGGFTPDQMLAEVRTAWSYRELTDEQFAWTLSLVRDGGAALGAYERFRKVELVDGRYVVPSARAARLHRANVGTITGPSTVELRYLGGRTIGHIEDSFVGRLREGERFYFAGKALRFVRLREGVALVRSGAGSPDLTPIWGGTRLPHSESLSRAVRDTLDRLARVVRAEEQGTSAVGGDGAAVEALAPELEAALPVVRAQARLSAVPREGELLIETLDGAGGSAGRSDGASRVFIYPFEGRLVHAGLSALLALRLGRLREATFTATYNDYGLELLCPEPFPFGELLTPALFTRDGLVRDALEGVNSAQLARLRFREIARVAGLVLQDYPGTHRGGRSAGASSSLLFDVLSEFDPSNLLLDQARREVLENQFEHGRLAGALDRLAAARPVRVALERPSPLALPLVAERIGAQTLSSESLEARVARMQRDALKAAGLDAPRRTGRS